MTARAVLSAVLLRVLYCSRVLPRVHGHVGVFLRVYTSCSFAGSFHPAHPDVPVVFVGEPLLVELHQLAEVIPPLLVNLVLFGVF